MKTTLGEKIIILRRRAGLSQSELAQKAGISRQGLTLIENDQSNVQYHTILAIARVFGLTPEINFVPCQSDLDLKAALKESLKLQSHYAKLLNEYDGGERMCFNSIEDLLNRLREVGTLPANTQVQKIDKEDATEKSSTLFRQAMYAAFKRSIGPRDIFY